jgi:YD repeat-containing protein
MRLGNGLVTSTAYEPRSFRLSQIQVSAGLLDLRYRYDRVGNVLAITDTVNAGQVQSFGYDARDRLVWAMTNSVGEGQYNEAYGYDQMGNIITRTVSGALQVYAYGHAAEVITATLSPTLTHRFYLPLVVERYGPDSPPPATLTQPFAVISTTAGFQAVYDRNGVRPVYPKSKEGG